MSYTRRVPTGIEALNNVMDGGYSTASVNIVHGPPGSGKTLYAMHFLADGANNGEQVLYISLDVSAEEIKEDYENRGVNIGGVYILDAVPSGEKREVKPYKELTQVTDAVKISELKTMKKKIEVDILSLKATMKDIFGRRRYHRVVVDSMSSLKHFYMNEINPVVGAHSFIQFLTTFLKDSVILLTFTDFQGKTDPLYEKYMSNTVIKMDVDPDSGKRAFFVEKVEGGMAPLKKIPFTITEEGINVK